MQGQFIIKKIAVLGAGVMGAQIAAQCVNAGIETLLFDLASKEGKPNALIDKAINNLIKLKPAPLGTNDLARLIQAKNYEDNLADLKECDLIIEAIAERLDWKEALYKRIAPHIKKEAILVSNTSGLSINTLASVLPQSLQHQFCGVHFFNPPRYMHLAELIPANGTAKPLLDHLETWLTSTLGKGVVHAKDTPNFIANRIGVFSLLATLHHAETMNIGLDEVDALTGALLGRPKSATFRTMDVVGLDTMQHVVNTMKEHLKDDPWHACYQLPDWLMNLIAKGSLGQKTGQGVYRKAGKTIEVFDLQTGDYRPAAGKVSDALRVIMHEQDPKLRMEALFASDDRQAQFLAACFRDLFHYCAYHLADIARCTRDVDLAIRWGFGWQQGPFETWQSAGVAGILGDLQKHIDAGKTLSDAPLPTWINSQTQFYTADGAFSPLGLNFVPRSDLAVYQKQFFPERVLAEPARKLDVLYENEGVRLSHLQDDIAIVSFKSKANSIGQAVLEGMSEAIDYAEKNCAGLIIYQQDANNFSVGADLRGVGSLVQAKNMQGVEKMIEHFQHVAMRLKYCAIPTLAALRGRALGGGCELMMHCDAVVAAFESYPGLVEAGVGLIPAGGGSKEMALRAASQATEGDLMVFLQPLYQQVAMATVAASAADARQKSFLKPTDYWVMNSDEVLYAGLARVKAMLAANYHAPIPALFKVAGREGHAKLKTGLVNWLEGGFISQHDYFLSDKLAYIFCGGNVNQGELVSEDWVLKLEREAFMQLLETPQTQARIAHLLETGKPLRN